MASGISYLPRVWMGSQISTKLLPGVVRPLAAHVKLTENCQAKCISCDYWQTRWQDGITTDRAVELVNEIEAAGIRTLRFTGGEPLLRKDFFSVLARSRTASFRQVVIQTNGLLLKKLHREINASAITKVAVSIDGLKETNDHIRGIRGYFDLGIEGIRLLRGKEIALSVTLNGLSARELDTLEETARSVGAKIEFNILSQSLSFLKNADVSTLWPGREEAEEITRFVGKKLHRPGYEVDYIGRYYRNEPLREPPCVLGFLQVFVMSNGDVMTGCYPLQPVGNVLREPLARILASDAYRRQAVAMIRRECPGCTCGVESSLAMKHAASSAFFEIGRLLKGEAPAASKATTAGSSPTA